MSTPIKTIDELRSEILRLEALKQQQELLLKPRFSSPSAIFASAMTLFPKSPTVDGIRHSGLFNQDFLGLVSRFVLPLALNKTLFRRSNFIVKAIVGVLSQKASNYISEEKVVTIWDKIKSAFVKKPKAEPVAAVAVEYNVSPYKEPVPDVVITTPPTTLKS